MNWGGGYRDLFGAIFLAVFNLELTMPSLSAVMSLFAIATRWV